MNQSEDIGSGAMGSSIQGAFGNAISGYSGEVENPALEILATAWAHYDSSGIVGNPVTVWTNRNGITARDLDVVVGTGANLTLLGPGSGINSTDYQGILSAGSVGLETSAGVALSNPMTIFDVFRPSVTTPAADQVIYDAESGASSMLFSDETNDDKYSLSQGTVIALTQAYDTDLHVFTSQLNGGATTKLTVSGVGSVTGDAGANGLNYGSIFLNAAGGDSTPGLYLERAIFTSALDATEVSIVQNYLIRKFT